MADTPTVLIWSACHPSNVEVAINAANRATFRTATTNALTGASAAVSSEGGGSSTLLSQADVAVAQVASSPVVALVVEPESLEAFGRRLPSPPNTVIDVNDYLNDITKAITPAMNELSANFPSTFVVIVSQTLAEFPLARQVLIGSLGVHMVVGSSTHSSTSLLEILNSICLPTHNNGKLTCTICNKKNLTHEGIYAHLPQYHGNTPFSKHANTKCPVCKERFSKSDMVNHFFHEHPPSGPPIPNRIKVSLFTFSLVVTRRKKDGKFLMVQEFCNQGYWLPGGGVDPGECPIKGGIRETLEEAGVDVKIKGILNINMQPGTKLSRLTFIFYAEPVDDDAEAKSNPDFESVGAAWVSLEELMSGSLSLRGREPLEWFPYVANGGEIHPLSLLEVHCRT